MVPSFFKKIERAFLGIKMEPNEIENVSSLMFQLNSQRETSGLTEHACSTVLNIVQSFVVLCDDMGNICKNGSE